jgi:hypothetical protein
MLSYTQLAQIRPASTSAISIYQCNAGEQVQAFVKICNVSSSQISARVFHDLNGSTYDETTALVWDLAIAPGGLLELDHIFINNASGHLACRTDVANAMVATVYGVVKT